MAYKMTKRGSLDNEITYEFFCDTVADMNAIENRYRTLGSIAIVLEGDSGGLEVYITNSQREWTTLNISTGGSSSAEIDEEIIAEIVEALLENNETINSLSEISETVSDDADTASDAATRATNAAGSALGSANSAASSASSAATAASNASSSASQAGSYASAASVSASTAADRATAAKSSADSAISAGASAVSAAQTAYQHANSAQNSAQAAQTALASITQDNSELAEDIEEIKDELDGKAPVIFDDDIAYMHENVDNFRIVDTKYAFGTAKYANKQNLITCTDKKSHVVNGVQQELYNNIVIFNGTCTASDDWAVINEEIVNLPAGTYTYRIEPYLGNSVLAGPKNMHLHLWYEGNNTTTRDMVVTVSVNTSVVTSTFTVNQPISKIRVWLGILKGSVYDDYRAHFSLFPSDVVITDTEQTPTKNSPVNVTLDTEMPVVYTLTHQSAIDMAVDTKEYIDGKTNLDDTLTVEGMPADAKAVGDIKANKIGHYEELTAGLADQLTSTVSIFDNAPYNFRTSGGSIDIGNRKDEQKIVGGGVFWHQMAPENFTDWGNTNCNITINNRQMEIVPATDDAVIKYLWIPMQDKHKILITGTFIHSASTTGIYVGLWRNSLTDADNYISRKYIQYIDIMEPTDFKYIFSSEGNSQVSLRFELTEGINTQDKITIKDLQIFDLTIMFGQEIADYIYELEQTTSGAGTAWFRKLFPKPYYEFFEGDYLFTRPQGYKTVGFNQWDEEWENGYYAAGTKMNSSNRIRSKNKIHVIPSTKYYINTQYELEIQEYNANQEFIKTSSAYQEIITTTNKTHYITFSTNPNSTTTYDYPICINLSWDGERDGQYEPYESYSYPIDSNVGILYGIPKLDENNQLYYDGNELSSDGTMTYRYDTVDLGTLAWDYSTAYSRFTSGAFSPIKKPATNDGIANIMCAPFRVVSANDTKDANDDFTIGIASSGSVCIRCSSFTDRTTFKQAMSGAYLIYEVATPSNEYFEPFTTTQVVNDFGTEELLDDRSVQMPIGHETNYMANLKAKLEMMPNSPDGEGDYIVRQVDGENKYIPLNIPMATNSQLGIVKGNSFGIRINNNGELYISAANISSEVKPGASNYLPIVPSNQHAAAFYGLAKAAGDTTQASSSNSVGTYTDNAKTAIQTMLDIPSKSYVDTKIPDAPTTDGTYTLQVTVTNNTPTYTWVSTGA